MKSFVLAVAMAVLAVPAVAQQTMTELFRIDAGTGWFQADAATRGMGKVPGGPVLVADRGSEGSTVYMLDPQTGREVGRLNTDPISGGTFPINKVAAADDGAVYVTNLGMPPNNPFRLWYFSDTSARPILAHEITNPTGRFGDDIAVDGKGGSTRILVSGGENPQLLLLEDKNGDGRFEETTITPTQPELVGLTNVAWEPGSDLAWLRQSTGARAPSRQYRIPSGQSTGRTGLVLEGYGPIGTRAMTADNFLIGNGPGLWNEGTEGLAGVAANSQSMTTLDFVTPESLMDGARNINGAGDVVWGEDGRTVYFLVTDNSISGWRLR